MEQYFKKSIDYKIANFLENYEKEYKNALEELIEQELKNLSNQKEKLLKTFLNSIEIFSVNSLNALLNFEENQDVKKMVQHSFQNIFTLVADKLYDLNETQIIAKYLDQIIRIIKIFFKENNFSLYSITSVSKLVVLLVVSKTITILNQKQIADLLLSLEINLDLRFFKYKWDEDTDESRLEYFKFKNKFVRNEDKNTVEVSDVEQIFRTWRFCVESLFDSFGKENFIANINQIQNYYEFCVKSCTYDHLQCEPYHAIYYKITRIVGNLNTITKDSIYFNLPNETNTVEKIKRIITIYKQVLIEDNYFFDGNVLISFGHEISFLLNHKDLIYGNRIFLENYLIVYETLFEIFFKAERKDALIVISQCKINLKQLIKQNKLTDLKNFNDFLIKKTIQALNFSIENAKKFDIGRKINQFNNKQSIVSIFAEFAENTYISYIFEDLKDKSFSKKLLDLAIEILKLMPESDDCFSFVSDILSKSEFYLLKNFPNETEYLLRELIILAFQANLNSKNAGLIATALGNLTEIIMPFPTIIDSIQNCLFENMIYKPIQRLNTIQDRSFYLIYNPMIKFLSFKKFSSDEIELEKLKSVFHTATNIDVLDSIQSDQSESNEGRILYFTTFYNFIFECLNERKDIASMLNEDLIELVNIIHERNDYINEFQNNAVTINYEIIEKLSEEVFKSTNSSISLVEILINVWFFLYEKVKSKVIQAKAVEIISLTGENFQDLMSKNAEKIWSFYVNKEKSNSTYLTKAIIKILPVSKELFLLKYFVPITEMILSPNNTILDNYEIIAALAESCPEYFFRINQNGEFIIVEFLNKAKKGSVDFSIAIGIIFQVNYKLIKKVFVLNEGIIHSLFEQKQKFLRFLFVNGEKHNGDGKVLKFENITTDMLIKIIYDINSYLVSTLEVEKNNEKIRKIIKDLIEIINGIKTSEISTLIYLLKSIAEIENRKYLSVVQEFKEEIKEIEKNNKLEAVKQATQVLMDQLENRDWEQIEIKLNKNENKIDEVKKTVKKNNSKIIIIGKEVKNQELRITNINENLNNVNEKLTEIDETLDEQETKLEKLDEKTLLNVPVWCKDLSKILSKNKNDWMLIAKRFNFNENDIKGWLNQNDPCLSMFQEIFVQYKTSDAIAFLLKIFKEVNNLECIEIIEKNLKQVEDNNKIDLNEDHIDKELIDNPPQIFVSYEWSSKEKAELLRKYLYDKLNEQPQNSIYKKLNIWFDDGNMGGGNNRNNRIDRGLRACSILICFITDAASKDQTCLNQITLAISLNKPIIPLLLDSKLKWPPSGSLGPILSEYLFIRFFQRPNELTNDERYWPVDKFNELVMQVKQLIPTSSLLNTNTKMPTNLIQPIPKESPEVFISYQWGKQKEIINLYNKLTELGLTCWLDIYQMGGGDSLYDKIDKGIRNCCLVISCVTTKYGLSANCRKEIALSDSLSKPIIPILLEENMKYPPEGPMAPTLSVIKYIDFTNADNQKNWDGDPFLELVDRMKLHLSKDTVTRVTSKACIIS